MRRLLGFLLWTLPVLLLAAVLVLAWSMLAERPEVPPGPPLAHSDVARARAVLEANDPRRAPPGARRSATLEQGDLTLVANVLLRRYLPAAAAQVELTPGRLSLKTSAALPLQLPRRHVNVLLAATAGPGLPELEEVRVGAVRLPVWAARWLGRELAERALADGQIDGIVRSLESLSVGDGRITLAYRWSPEAVRAVSARWVATEVDPAALAAYRERVAALAGGRRRGQGALPAILAPLLALAQERSAQADPVAEHRALLLVLGGWASGRGAGALLPGTAQDRSLPAFGLTLHGRRDLAQHFLVSAALAAEGDGALADAVGLWKEVSDAEKRSGFSFVDLAADRAGARFGEVAVASPESARRVQRLLRAGSSDGDLMPPAADLPENLSADEFARRFGKVGSPAFEALRQEIERRIGALPLYAP
ncbi:MAG: hypothetical protein MUF57_00315 [Gammaproteobacteria bacterium]|jgi:hypothetical protein|nr:hypothetical protein [Gammaproteobacteria bacterium]